MSRTPQTAFDLELRAALDQLVPEVQTGGKWPRVEAKLKHKRRQSRIVQAVALAAAVVLLVAFGTLAADVFRQPDLIVIDDRDTDEVAGSEATHEVARTSEEELLQTIHELIEFVEAGEIELSWAPEEENGVTETIAVRALRSWEEQLLAPDMTLILQPDANQEEIGRLRQEIESLAQVERYEYLGSEARTGEGEFEPPPARFKIWLFDGLPEQNESPTSTLPSGPETLSTNSAVASVAYSPPNLPEIREGVEELLSHAEPKTAEAKAWLEQHLERGDQLLQTIQELIAFVEAGDVDLAWEPDARSDFPADPVELLRSMAEGLSAGPTQLSVRLSRDATEADIERVRQLIESLPQVERYELLSKDEVVDRIVEGSGLSRKEILRQHPVESFEVNFEVWPTNPELAEEIASAIEPDPAVDEVNYGEPFAVEDAEIFLSQLLAQAEANTSEAEKWLAAHRVGAPGAASEGASAFPPVVPATEGDPFGPGPGNTGDRPGYLTAWPDLSLEELRRRVLDQVEAPVDPDTGRSYVYLPSELPEDFLPAGAWGEKLGSYHNPAVDGAFYGAAFSNNETAIRLVANPDLTAPSFTLGALASPEVRDNEQLWKATGASVMGREAYELVRDGTVYFRLELPENTVYVYGPEEIRIQIWQLAEALAPVVAEPPA